MKKIMTQQELVRKLPKGEFACIKNPEGVFPEYEYIPMGVKQATLKDIRTIVCDMDGTTTSTENLCIHSLEFMVRKISGKMTTKEWAGLDKVKDYPHIIGNSTTRHIEYLIDTYRFNISDKHLQEAFLEGAIWFLRYGKDPQRINEVKNSCKNMGCGALINDVQLSDKSLLEKYLTVCQIDNKSKIVKAAIDIYYKRYHEILMAVDRGEKIPMIESIGDINPNALIEPMPGVAIFISMVLGLLNAENAVSLNPILEQAYAQKCGKNIESDAGSFAILAERFRKSPVKLALVTSSIYYEANIVIKQVFQAIIDEITHWPIDEESRNIIADHFRDYHHIYDAFITANDSHEIRLKPHRDLYSIALNTMNINSEDFDTIMGFEDSESGTIAIRAAGIPCAIALPFAETSGHDLSAASHIVEGGLPEVIIKHKCFIK